MAQPWSIVRNAAKRHFEAQIAEEQRHGEQLRERILGQVKPIAARALESGICRRLWVFGSYAWGTPTDDSDLDVLVDGDAEQVARLLSEVMRLPLHVLAFAEAPQSLRDRVQDDGLLL